MKNTKRALIYGNIIAISILALFVLLSLALKELDIKCVIASNSYMYCPGCGGTRAVFSMLHFDFISALRYNIVVPLIGVLYLYYNIGAIISIIKGKEGFFNKKQLIPIYVFIGIVIANFIFRNILLWGFRIDLIGDFIPYN